VASFSISGIRVRIDQSWFIAFVLFAWTLSEGYFPFQAPNYSTLAYWSFGAVSALGLFACVLIHELSHCVVARRLGVPVRQITLFIFGGLSEMGQSSNSPNSEFRIAIAGPVSSIGLGAVFAGVAYASSGRIDQLVYEALHYLVYVNFLLAMFNLIPGFPLDGGRVLRSYLWHRSGNLRQATRSASRVGAGFASAMIALGFLALFSMHVMIGIWLLVVGLFLKKSAENEYRSFQVRTSLEHVKVSDIMAPPVSVRKGTTIADLIHGFVFHYHDRAFPVVDRGQFIGMIDVRAFKKVPPDDWSSTYIDPFLADSSLYCVLDPDMDAPDALRLLMEYPMSKAPVVRNDVLLGFLTRHDMVEVIALKSDLAA
jgi:Zn-dependent protease